MTADSERPADWPAPLPGLIWTRANADAAGRAVDMAEAAHSILRYIEPAAMTGAERQKAIDLLEGSRRETADLLERLTGVMPSGTDERDRLRAELDQARAERDAANAQCAKAVREREEQAARWDRQDCERSDAIGGLECRVLELRDERDRARNTAAALEAENAVLRPAVDELTRRRADAARATGPDPWAENAVLLDGLARLRKTSCDGCDAAEVAHNVLASVDPLRDEPEAADRG